MPFGCNTALSLPYRFTNGAPEILLVTTRQTKRWIIPKGWPIKGLKPAKSVAREAYEEAGVRRSVKSKAIGIFSYEKRSVEDGITISCDVRLFSAAREAAQQGLAGIRAARC